MGDLSWLIEKLYYIPGIIIGASFMQFAQAYTAYLMGDMTPKESGRLTIEPWAHIDALGFLFIIIAGFGWAKPVPVNSDNFKHKRLGELVTSIAAPVTNLLISFITLLVVYVVFNVFSYNNDVLFNILISLFYINIVFCVFNLLPIPPLTGSKILISLLPEKIGEKVNALEKYFFILILALMVTKSFGYILNPMVVFLANGLEDGVIFLLRLFGLI